MTRRTHHRAGATDAAAWAFPGSVGCVSLGSQEVYRDPIFGERMPDEPQRRNSSQRTTTSYIHAVEEFAKYFRRSPEHLGPSHIREYQVHLFGDRKLSPRTIQSRSSALRFLFVKTLRRPYLPDEIPSPKCPRTLPTVLGPEEAARQIDSARNLMHHTMLMTL
jgi:integrase/recombinase XerD